MEKTSIFTLKSQQHILGDNLMSSGPTGNDISALRDGPAGPLSIGILSTGDYDKFYITKDNPSFKNTFIPSSDTIDNVITSNLSTNASAIPIALTEKLNILKGQLNVESKQTRPLTVTSSTITYQDVPNPDLDLSIGLTATVQTRLMINTANLNLQFKLFYKNLPVFIGMDFATYYIAGSRNRYNMHLLQQNKMSNPANQMREDWQNSTIYDPCITILDPGTSSSLTQFKKFPTLLGELTLEKNRGENHPSVPHNNNSQTGARGYGNFGNFYKIDFFYGYLRQNNQKSSACGAIMLDDPFYSINKAIQESYYYDSHSLASADPSISSKNKTKFYVEGFPAGLYYAYRGLPTVGQHPSQFHDKPFSKRSAFSKSISCSDTLLFTETELAMCYQQTNDVFDFNQGIFMSINEDDRNNKPAITRYYMTNMYDYVTKNFSVDLAVGKQLVTTGINTKVTPVNNDRNNYIFNDPTSIFRYSNVTVIDVEKRGQTTKLGNLMEKKSTENFPRTLGVFDNTTDYVDTSDYFRGRITKAEFFDAHEPAFKGPVTPSDPTGFLSFDPAYRGVASQGTFQFVDTFGLGTDYFAKSLGSSNIFTIDYKDIVLKRYIPLLNGGSLNNNYLTLNDNMVRDAGKTPTFVDGQRESIGDFQNSIDIKNFLQTLVKPSQDLCILPGDIRIGDRSGNPLSDNYSITRYESVEKCSSDARISAKFISSGQSNVGVPFTQFPNIVDLDANINKPLLGKRFSDIFKAWPYIGKISLGWCFFDVDFKYANINNKVFFDVGCNNVPLGSTANNQFLNIKSVLTRSGYNLGSKGLTYTYNPFPNGLNAVNGLQLNFNYNGGITTPFVRRLNIPITTPNNLGFGRVVGVNTSGNIPGKFMNISQLTLRPEFGELLVDFSDTIGSKSLLVDLQTVLGGYKLIGTTGTIGISGTYNWSAIPAQSGRGFENIYVERNIPLSTSLTFNTSYVGEFASLTEQLNLNNNFFTDNYSQVFLIPPITYVSGATSIPELNFNISSINGFNPSTAFVTFNWRYADDTIQTSIFNLNFLTSTPTDTYRFPQMVIQDNNKTRLISSFFVDKQYLNLGITGSSIANSYVTYLSNNPVYGITGSEIPAIGVTIQDCAGLELDMTTMKLVIHYYYGDSLFNQTGYQTIDGSDNSVFILDSERTTTLSYLPKQQRQITIPYSSDTNVPLYIVNVRSNKSGYTFTQDPIPERVYDDTTFLNYKILKYGYSGFSVGQTKSVGYQVDINNSNLVRDNFAFQYIPGNVNNFNNGLIDQYLNKFISTVNGEDYMTKLFIKQGVTGFLNDFFVFNNTVFNTSLTGGHTGTFYAFITAITGEPDPSPLGSTGLFVSNGIVVGGSPRPKFINNTETNAEGFIQETINFDYNNYVPSQSDKLTYSGNELNNDGSGYKSLVDQTFNMRILRNSKDDKYDYTVGVTFVGNSNPVASSVFYGLSPNTLYSTSFLTYNEGPTANTGLIENFQFKTGVTGIVFNGEFKLTQDTTNPRKCYASVSFPSFTKFPAKLANYLPDPNYQILLESGDSSVQLYRNDDNHIYYNINSEQINNFYNPVFSEDAIIYNEIYSSTAGVTFTSVGSCWTTYSPELRAFRDTNVNKKLHGKFNGLTYSFNTMFSTPISSNYPESDLYVKTSDNKYILAPPTLFNLNDPPIGGVTGEVFFVTSENIANRGFYKDNKAIPNGETKYVLYNLERGKTYTPKMFIIPDDGSNNEDLIVNKNRTNCLFGNPIVVPSLPKMEIVLSDIPFSYKRLGKITNFNLYYKGFYGDLSCINPSFDLVLRITYIPTGKIVFQTVFPAGSNPFFPMDIEFDLYELTPSTSYFGTDFEVACAHYIPDSSDNLITSPFSGVPGNTNLNTGGEITSLGLGSSYNRISYKNYQKLSNLTDFSTNVATDSVQTMSLVYAITPHLLDSVIKLDEFEYYNYGEKENSYTQRYGGVLKLTLKDQTAKTVQSFNITLENVVSQNLEIKLNKSNLKYGEKYDLLFEYIYTDYNGVSRTGTSTYSNSFMVIEQEVFSISDFSITPLINKFVMKVENKTNFYAGQTLESLNRKLAVMAVQQTLTMGNPRILAIEKDAYEQVIGGVTGKTGIRYDYRELKTFINPKTGIRELYRKTADNYKLAKIESFDTFNYTVNSKFILSENNFAPTGGIPINGFNWVKIPNFSNDVPGLSDYDICYPNSSFEVVDIKRNPYFSDRYNPERTDDGLNAYSYEWMFKILNRFNVFDNNAQVVFDKLIPSTEYAIGMGVVIDEANYNTDFTPLLAVGTTIKLLNDEIVADILTTGVDTNFCTLNNLRYKGSTGYVQKGKLFFNGDLENAYVYGPSGTTFPNLLNLPTTTITYQPQESIDIDVADYSKPCYLFYTGGFTGECSVEQPTLTHSTASIILNNLSYTPGTLNEINTTNNLYIMDVASSYKKTVPLSRLDENFNITIELDNLTANTTYSDLQIYYDFGSIERYSLNFISIPSFTTTDDFTGTYSVVKGVNSVYVKFANISVDGQPLGAGKYFKVNDTRQEFKFYFYLKDDAGDSGKTNKISTDYFDTNVDSSNNGNYGLIKVGGTTPLVTYDKMYIYYRYLDSKSNFRIIEKTILL